MGAAWTRWGACFLGCCFLSSGGNVKSKNQVLTWEDAPSHKKLAGPLSFQEQLCSHCNVIKIKFALSIGRKSKKNRVRHGHPRGMLFGVLFFELWRQCKKQKSSFDLGGRPQSQKLAGPLSFQEQLCSHCNVIKIKFALSTGRNKTKN